jgi:segregation and condensation protein A
MVGFVQVQALGELTVRWTGPQDRDFELEIDEYAGGPAEPASPAASGEELRT